MALPRVVVVHRATEYDGLIARHGTHGQAAFFLGGRDRSIDPVFEAHSRQATAMSTVLKAIPGRWRRAVVARDDLSRFLSSPDDVVVAVGQDGLIPNVAKYLDGQPVIGINPDASRNDGILVRHLPAAAVDLLADIRADRVRFDERAMVRGSLADGQSIVALNELFIGHRSHQSARYTVRFDGTRERHSSSGVVVATGTGATGWARSICRERGAPIEKPAAGDDQLLFLVREAFPSVRTQTNLTAGSIDPDDKLLVRSEMDDGGVIFGDGVEPDALQFGWGEVCTVALADQRLRLVA